MADYVNNKMSFTHEKLHFFRRAVPIILQAEAAECGLACLAMVAHFHGKEIDVATLRRQYPTSQKGMSLSSLIQISAALGLQARPLRAELEYLKLASLPVLLHWDMGHFVVLVKVRNGQCVINDPACGEINLPLSVVSSRYTGILIEFQPTTQFVREKKKKKLSLQSLTGKMRGTKRALVQVLGLAAAIEFLTILLPLQVQWVVDRILLQKDVELLFLVTLAFAVLVIARVALLVARGWVLTWLGASLSFQWMRNLFNHALRLPISFFEKRYIGDILTRFTSVKAIQATLTGSFIEAILDGLMSVAILGMLLFYSVPMAFVVLFGALLYSCFRWMMHSRICRLSEQQLVYDGKQHSEIIESIRGIRAIKLANKQALKAARVTNFTLEATYRGMIIQRIAASFMALNQGLFGLQKVILLAIGAYFAVRDAMSPGMLVAFLAFVDQFNGRVGSFIDKLMDLAMVRLHLDRISDLAHEPAEVTTGQFASTSDTKLLSLELRNVGFRYSANDPWVFRSINLKIHAGSSIAIVGPSGCGKSTLVKLMLGLIEPTEGSIHVNGIDLKNFGLENYRGMIGAVLQDDDLFAGSIAENISFFDDHLITDQIHAAAIKAAIHSDILAMPMGYESLIGDMGSILSGGQKQRIMLARALYRQPNILILDEATSHLDTENERAINSSIRDMAITKVVIAHRVETIRSADTIFELATAPLTCELV